ncbi:MAG: ribosome-associated translation inhibitor RaiA [Deltaproteobacteria bacterium]|nr:MAG: ribosome-associated translation inhibitor RaiA [Deltaproteobacteria bacterium]
MQVQITFRNMAPEEGIKEYVQKKALRLKRLLNEPIEMRVILESERFRYLAEVNLNADGLNIVGRQTEEDLHAAIDLVMDKVERQVKDQKERNKGNRLRSRQVSIHLVAPAERRIVKSKPYPVKPMSLQEAAEELEARGDDFIIFIDVSSDKVNILYKRRDGNYGLIEPEY